MNPLVSIIVPIYNSELYLRRCFDSIVNQTYKNIEVLLINDGSPDKSQLICEEYQNKYSNFTLYNKVNGGLGSARNYGLDNCKGDYISFLDSDDWIDYDYIEHLLLLCKNNAAQFATIDLDITSSYRISKVKKIGVAAHVYRNDDVLFHYFKGSINDSNLFSVCTTLFERSVIISERFRVGKLNEDMDFKYRVLQKGSSWAISDEKKYHYFQGGDSMSSGIVKVADFDLIEASNMLLRFAEETNNSRFVRFAKVGTIKPYFSILVRIAAYGCVEKLDEKIEERKCLSQLRDNYLILLFSPMKLSRKIVMTSFMLSYPLTKKTIRFILKLRK